MTTASSSRPLFRPDLNARRRHPEAIGHISGLTIGDAIRVGDLQLPSGVTTDVDPEEAVVIGQGPQAGEVEDIPEADAEARQRARPPKPPRPRPRARAAEARARRGRWRRWPAAERQEGSRRERARRPARRRSGQPRRGVRRHPPQRRRESSCSWPRATAGAAQARQGATPRRRGRASAARRVVLAFPLTYMNDSGQAVAALVAATASTTRRVVIVHDELDLPPGR